MATPTHELPSSATVTPREAGADHLQTAEQLAQVVDADRDAIRAARDRVHHRLDQHIQEIVGSGRDVVGTGSTQDGILTERVLGNCDVKPTDKFYGELRERTTQQQFVDFMLPKWELLRDLTQEQFDALQAANVFPETVNGVPVTLDHLHTQAGNEIARLTRLVEVKFGGAMTAPIAFEQKDAPWMAILERVAIAWGAQQAPKWTGKDTPGPGPGPGSGNGAQVGAGGGGNVAPPVGGPVVLGD